MISPLQSGSARRKSVHFGVLAQLVERLNGIEEVRGSIPLGSRIWRRFCPRLRKVGAAASERAAGRFAMIADARAPASARACRPRRRFPAHRSRATSDQSPICQLRLSRVRQLCARIARLEGHGEDVMQSEGRIRAASMSSGEVASLPSTSFHASRPSLIITIRDPFSSASAARDSGRSERIEPASP